MNKSEPASHQRFFCLVKDQTEGPFDLVELAGHFKQSIIGPDTPIRRDGEEGWIEFRELPEFASAQEMSIETIARHLEERARAQRSPKAKTPRFPWAIAVSMAWVLAVVGLTMLLIPVRRADTKPSMLQLPDADPWPRTEGEHFSIRCPVPMRDPGFGQYRALVDGNEFKAEGAQLPGAYGHDARFLVDGVCDQFVVMHGQRQVTSDRVIEVSGHYGREVLYSKFVGPMKVIGGIRAVAGRGYIVIVFAYMTSGLSRDADLHHFFNSLEVH